MVIAVPCLAAGRPRGATLRKAFEANKGAVVEVIGPKKTGAGVLIGADGHIVTSVEFVGLEEARVRIGGAELPARVLMADARLKVAVVKVEGEGFHSAAVHLRDSFAKGEWLVGIRLSQKKGQPPTPLPLAGQVFSGPSRARPFLETSLPLLPGSPLFDPSGRLVAICVERRGNFSSRALPLPAIKQQLTAALEMAN